MKLKRINRIFLAFLLASGLQLSLTTCTNEGRIIASDELTIEDTVEENNEDLNVVCNKR